MSQQFFPEELNGRFFLKTPKRKKATPLFFVKPKKRKIANRKNKMLKLTFLKKKQNVIF